MNTTPTIGPARVEFGRVLRTHREARHLPLRRVADMLGRPTAEVEAFEAGHLVPEGRTWDKYKGIVDRRLPAYSDLRNRALVEYHAERKTITEAMERKRMNEGTNGHHKNGVNLTHKPLAAISSVKIPTPDSPAGAIVGVPDARTVNPGQAVTYHAAPPSKPLIMSDSKPYDADKAQRTRDALAKLPKGWKQTEQINKRREFALNLIRQRPNIRESGADSLQDALRRTFGVGLSQSFTDELRAQVKREIECEHNPGAEPAISNRAPEPLKPTPAAVQESIDAGRNPSPAAREVLSAAQAQTVNDADLEVAVQLVLGAVPGLRSFTIEVDDHGEASVNYTVREVKVTERGGSLKVKR